MVGSAVARYGRAVRFLSRLVDWEREVGLTFTQETIRLDLFRSCLDRIGNPQRAFRTILVAGTKGKGSTSYLLASLLRAHGWKTGLFTSPHLENLRERIRVDGAPLSRLDFASVVEDLESRFPFFEKPGRSRTYFETLTAAAFLHFRESAVDVAVLEVGLGGRLDATNVVEPELSIITSVGRDHMKALGGNLVAIAAEKAGVMRPGRHVLLGPLRPRLRAFLLDRARRIGARPKVHGVDFLSRSLGVDEGGTEMEFAERGAPSRRFRLGLLGRHQVGNAALALAALPLLGLPERIDVVRPVLRRARWPGRAEFLARTPPVLLDGAHNGDSARALARLMGDLYPGRRSLLLFGGSKGKEHGAIFRSLLPIASDLIVTESTHPRRRAAAELASVAARVDGSVPLRVVPDVGQALREALARQGDRPLLITGSLYLAGDVRRRFRRVVAARRAAVLR